jgi:putative addiction module component (TIGR02574 family)
MCSGQIALEEYDLSMDTTLKNLPVEERIRIVEDLWDSIARDQRALPLTQDQIAELDRRLDAFEIDGDLGRPAKDVISDIRKRL